jgi:hypothetical protein
MIKFFVIVGLASVLHSLNFIEPNFELPTAVLDTNGHRYFGIQDILGTGNEKSNDRATLEVNIGLPFALFGEKSKAKWGIDCTNKENNSCEVTDLNQNDFFLYSKLLVYQKAALHIRLDSNNNLNTTNPVVDKMEARLVVGGNNWILNDWGVLGLSPQGSFSKYFTSVYRDNASLLLLYQSTDSSSEKIDFSLRSFVNIRYNETSVAKVFEINAKNNYWSSEGSMIFISPEFSFTNVSICFNTMKDEIIQVADPEDRCDAVKKIICDGKIGSNCTKANADFLKAQNLKITFSTSNFEFLPSEYLFFKSNGEVGCRFGDIKDLRAGEICEPTSELAIGRYFLRKYIPVFKYNFGQNAQFVLLNQFTPPYNPNSVKLWLWVVLGIAGIALIIGVAGFIISKKRRQAHEGDYLNFEGPPVPVK